MNNKQELFKNREEKRNNRRSEHLASALAVMVLEVLIEHYGSPGTGGDRWFMSPVTTPAREPNPDKGRARLEQAGWWIDYTIQRPVSLGRGKERDGALAI